jgi:hypothetical protein
MAVQQAKSKGGEPYSNLLNGYEADGFVVDNLSMKYYLDNAVFSTVERAKNAVIQNCTVEWGGEHLHQIQSAEPTNNYCFIGDGIYCVANNATIRNNYMRHSGNACTFEDNGATTDGMGTYLAEGNLIENCGQGIRTSFWKPDKENVFDEFILRDNIILDTGNGMNSGCFEEPVAIDLGFDPLQWAKRMEVSNNVMIGSTLAIMRIPSSSTVEMNIHNNVFAQSGDGVLLTECPASDHPMTWHMMEDAKEK